MNPNNQPTAPRGGSAALVNYVLAVVFAVAAFVVYLDLFIWRP